MNKDDTSIADSIPPGRFPAWFEKELLEVIEAQGGIARTLARDHHLRAICNSNTAIFGTESSAIRTRVGKRVSKLQEKYKDSKQKYLKYLKKAGVAPFSQRVSNRNSNISSQQSETSDISVEGSDGGDTSDESESVLERPKPVTRGRRGPKSIKKSPNKAEGSGKKAPPISEVSIKGSKLPTSPLKMSSGEDGGGKTAAKHVAGLKSPNAFNEAEEQLVVPDEASELAEFVYLSAKKYFLTLLTHPTYPSLPHPLQLSLMLMSIVLIITASSWFSPSTTFLTLTNPTMSGLVSFLVSSLTRAGHLM